MKNNTVLFLCTFISISFFSYSQCVTPPSGIVSWWTADSNTLDAIGDNDGTAINGVTYTAGIVDEAFIFDGIDDVIVVPGSAELDITGDVTVELWAKQTGFTNPSQQLISKGAGFIPNDESTAFAMRFEGATIQCIFEDATGGNVVLIGPSFEDFQWHHYVYVRQGNQHQLYADGFDFGWESFTNPPGSTIGLPLTIGAQFNNPSGMGSDYDYFFSGEIDEVTVYNRALSSSEILDLFNAGSSGKCKDALSLDELALTENLKVYPNPVDDVATFKINGLDIESEELVLSIFDMKGVELLKDMKMNSVTAIDVSVLSKGIYLYIIQNANDVVESGKLIKK
ncbi:MAG: T9SS type A sorting domain-containing protein [Psychroserpens sp.]|nr:T9SS type A sorting domain-containing protein [Psychroserpens sp.]